MERAPSMPSSGAEEPGQMYPSSSAQVRQHCPGLVDLARLEPSRRFASVFKLSDRRTINWRRLFTPLKTLSLSLPLPQILGKEFPPGTRQLLNSNEVVATMKFSNAPYPSFTLVLTSERASFPGGSVLRFDPPIVPNYPKPPHKRLMSTITYEREQPIQAVVSENELDSKSSLADSEEAAVAPGSASGDNTEDVNKSQMLLYILLNKLRIRSKSKASKTT